MSHDHDDFPSGLSFDSLAVRAGQVRTAEGEHSEPIFLTSSFVFGSAAEAAARFGGKEPGNIYSRFTNPTVRVFEERLAALEGGERCVATSSGMAAILATCLGLLQAGDHVVSSRSIFGTTNVLFDKYLKKFGVATNFVPLADVSAWEQAITPQTKLFFLETPSNPLCEVADIAALAELARVIRELGSNPEVRVVSLGSEGKGAFCAGASFAELQSIADEATGKKFFMGFATLILAMIRCPKFIVARVHGKTVGGGVGIVAASDYVLATSAASVRLSELAVGIGPFVVGPCIERKIGLAAFSAMAVDADWRDAAWCERHGLYARVYSDTGEMDDAIAALARTLAGSNPEAMAQLKQVFWAGTDEWHLALADRAEMSGTLVLSEFTRNAIARFKTGGR